jgi:DNA-directed RNA polymerase subunit E'/Rpb7
LENAEGLVIQVVRFTQIEEPKIKTVAEVRAIAREHTVGAITTLVNVHKNKKAPPAARVAAATAILDRGWGKATGDLENAEGLVIQVVRFTQIEEPKIKTVEGTIIDNEGGDRDN